jgi:hypothetical protein
LISASQRRGGWLIAGHPTNFGWYAWKLEKSLPPFLVVCFLISCQGLFFVFLSAPPAVGDKKSKNRLGRRDVCQWFLEARTLKIGF